MTKEGLNFLDKDLYANPGKFTVVILHHQLQAYTKGEINGDNDFDKFVAYNAEEVRKVLDNYPQVAMTLSGHRHLSTRYKVENDIAYFTCPSTMTFPMRYIVFNVSDKEISYQSKNVPLRARSLGRGQTERSEYKGHRVATDFGNSQYARRQSEAAHRNAGRGDQGRTNPHSPQSSPRPPSNHQPV